MPIGFVAFPLIARPLGVETTLLAAAVLAAATNVAVALAPGVRAVDDDEVAAPLATPRAA
jgi:hypothetical protein